MSQKRFINTILIIVALAVVGAVVYVVTIRKIEKPQELTSSFSLLKNCLKNGSFESGNINTEEIYRYFPVGIARSGIDGDKLRERGFGQVNKEIMNSFKNFLHKHPFACRVNDGYEIILKIGSDNNLLIDFKNLNNNDIFRVSDELNIEDILAKDEQEMYNLREGLLDMIFSLDGDILSVKENSLTGINKNFLINLKTKQRVDYDIYYGKTKKLLVIRKNGKEWEIGLSATEDRRGGVLGELGVVEVRGITVNNEIVEPVNIAKKVSIELAKDTSGKMQYMLIWNADPKVSFDEDFSRAFINIELSFYWNEDIKKRYNKHGEVESGVPRIDYVTLSTNIDLESSLTQQPLSLSNKKLSQPFSILIDCIKNGKFSDSNRVTKDIFNNLTEFGGIEITKLEDEDVDSLLKFIKEHPIVCDLSENYEVVMENKSDALYPDAILQISLKEKRKNSSVLIENKFGSWWLFSKGGYYPSDGGLFISFLIDGKFINIEKNRCRELSCSSENLIVDKSKNRILAKYYKYEGLGSDPEDLFVVEKDDRRWKIAIANELTELKDGENNLNKNLILKGIASNNNIVKPINIKRNISSWSSGIINEEIKFNDDATKIAFFPRITLYFDYNQGKLEYNNEIIDLGEITIDLK